MNFVKEIIDAIFPEHCLACGRKGSVLCAFCERTIVSKPILHQNWITTLFNYHQPIVKKAVQDLKFNNRKSVAGYFGNALYREFFSELARKPKDAENIVLIPIPGGAEGYAKRGYNHAAEISFVICQSAKRANLPIVCETDILYKVIESSHQSKTSDRSARKKNIEGVFAVRNFSKIKGKTIVLVDDVVTTGETMNAARKVLQKAGAKKIIGIAVAH